MRRFWKDGDPFIWLTGGALAICLLMVFGLVGLIVVGGLGYFWPSDVARFTLKDGSQVLGQVVDRERVTGNGMPGAPAQGFRLKVKQGNRDLSGGVDFLWVQEDQITQRAWPPEAAVFERLEWGNLYGVVRELRDAGKTLARGEAESWAAMESRLPAVAKVTEEIRHLEKDEVAALNVAKERTDDRLEILKLKGQTSGSQVDGLKKEQESLAAGFAQVQEKLRHLREGLTATVLVSAERGQVKDLPLAQIVRVYKPNSMGLLGKAGLYIARFWEFIWDDPRESNTEGGVFPAIFGTVMMVLLMSLFVTPLGVLAALYLREYAKQGPLVSLVRIAVNNLAGVPSIVFGIFGMGFFIYTVGYGIDRAFFSWKLPAPTFGTGGILWASLTLALLTVPVVIVATEEGLASIPKGLREGSLALGATKWETTWRVVIPSLMPSILTGLILAMARAAGEVAPLMITGVVKYAPARPFDSFWPFIHFERKFMHLGFHIYDVGFQSPNVDAARPMVFATAFLLLVIVVALNLTAIVLRKRLRKQFAGSAL